MTWGHQQRNRGRERAPFTEVEVRFPSADGTVELSGSYVAPCGRRDAPAAVLVAGTGPVDRDVTFLKHRLFRTLAHSLARAGIASLRYDKRGVGHSEGDFSTAGPDDFIADVLGAMKYLVGQVRLASDQVGLLGHSEGGMVALTAAATAPETPFCVALACPLLSGEENLVRSFALLARGSLDRDGIYDKYVSELTVLLRFARAHDASVSPADALTLADSLAPRIVNQRTQDILGGKALTGTEFLDLLASPCLETCLSWDPSRTVPLVTCPVLFVYGGRDVQAPAAENVPAARALIERLDKDTWAVREIGEVNHVFQRCATGMPDEYSRSDHVMSGDVVREVAAWIASNTRG